MGPRSTLQPGRHEVEAAQVTAHEDGRTAQGADTELLRRVHSSPARLTWGELGAAVQRRQQPGPGLQIRDKDLEQRLRRDACLEAHLEPVLAAVQEL